MRNFFILFLLFSSLFLTGGFSAINQVQGQNPNTYYLQIQGVAWHQTELKILVITPENESWWNPIYINSVLRAIGQWNDAIQNFASNNINYAYLSFLKLQPTVSNRTQPHFDIYLNWTKSTLENTADILGLTSYSTQNYAITNCTISLAAHTGHGDALVDGDMQNIALHELGHSLALGHSNDTEDIMYPAYALLGAAHSISTLDVYGVATTFAWMTYQTKFFPVTEWLQGGLVFSPAEIQYDYLPVSPQNARPQTLENNPIVQTLILMLGILIHPDIFAVVLVFFSVLIIFALISRKGKKAQR